MQKKADGQFYAPRGKVQPVCARGEFRAGVIGLAHGHIYGMCNGLTEAGAELHSVYDEDPAKVAAFIKRFPDVRIAESEAQILENSSLDLVVAAPVPDERGPLGCRVLEHDKHYFCDKPPFISLEQVKAARAAVEKTGKKFGVYYSERLHVEAAVCAEQLLAQNAIGRVLSVAGFGPHRANIASRPAWFFDKKRYGGILVDLGCHQIEQFLQFADTSGAWVTSSRVANYAHKEYPDFEDFGDMTLTAVNGATAYFRVDWFTPDGLGTWGDGRTIILGTDGCIELRKYIDVAADPEGDHVILVNRDGEEHIRAAGKYGYPFFGRFIRDCLDGTETAMKQEQTFHAIELAIEAQEKAVGSAW